MMFFSFFRKNNKTGHKTQVFRNNKPCESNFLFKFLFLLEKSCIFVKSITIKTGFIMKRLIYTTVVSLFSLLLLSCSKGAKTVLEKAEMATFIIYTFDEYGSPAGSGSGFFIDKEGIGITNYHVLDGAQKAVLRLKDGKELEIDKVLASDKKWDIAKFSVVNKENEHFSYLKFSNDEVSQGDKVYNLGAPIGLEQTFADGLVSSLRTDSHGQIIQVSIPISGGSSGSPIMNEYGDVVGVATFKSTRGENINFGVAINDEKLSLMTSNPFEKSNRQFNKKENFVILNVPSDQESDLILNALEFKKDATIAYLSYTNLDMSMNGSAIWCKTGAGDEGFFIKDNDSSKKYYIVSSTLGISHEQPTSVPLATVCKFQVYFPAISNKVKSIDIKEGNNPRWSFSDINLDYYRNNIKINMENYQKEYAYSTMHEGELDTATSIFESILDNDPENIQALNALGIISYVIDNNQDAIRYFTEVIKNHPNSSTGYLNRSCVYKYQNDLEKAVVDLTKAINIEKGNPDFLADRAAMYISLKKWNEAKADLDNALSMSEFVDKFNAYYLRGACNTQLEDIKAATEDLKQAYDYATTEEMKQMVVSAYEKIHPRDDNSQYVQDAAASYFRGSIGSFPIVMYLTLSNGGKASGWYYYESKGANNKLVLSGNYNQDGDITLYEFDETGNHTGKFVGQYNNREYSGTFSAYGNSSTYSFSLIEL